MADSGASETRSSVSEPPTSPVSTHSAVEGAGATLTGPRRALLAGLRVLPKNAMSRAMGRFAAIHWPAPIQRAQIRLFARLVGVDLREARDGVEAFDSLQQFFTRALRPGVRPIEGDADCLVSPCDGAWGEAGRIEAGTMLQVKGRPYRVADLLDDAELGASFEGGRYATFYLSPRDYHRFHTPTAGRITRLDYHPGALWPVNSVGLLGVDRLFARNERVCAFLEPSCTDAPILMIAVGATMVGSIRVTFDELRTNVAGATAVRRLLSRRAPHFERGQEWGHFEFGSTIVMLTPPGEIELDARPTGTPLRLGEKIGRLRTPSPGAAD